MVISNNVSKSFIEHSLWSFTYIIGVFISVLVMLCEAASCKMWSQCYLRVQHWKAIVSQKGRQLNRLTDNTTQRKQPLFPLPPMFLFGVFHSPALNLKAQHCSENNRLKPEGKLLHLTHVQTTMSSSSPVFGCAIVFPLKLMEKLSFTMVLVVLVLAFCVHSGVMYKHKAA